MRAALELVRRGAISAEDLVAAIERQHDERPPLGQIAIEERLLTPRQVREVLHSQEDTPHLRFGELAVQMGLVTQHELGFLLLRQLEAQGRIVDHLVAMGCIDADDALTAECANRRGAGIQAQPA